MDALAGLAQIPEVVMADIEQRTNERENALREQLADARRMARPDDYVFDKAQEQFWDLREV